MPAGRNATRSAVFLDGPILRHVLTMSFAGAIGLIAIFVVDLLSLIYISWLGDAALTAGVGFASQLSFFVTSINVGLSIATGALVAQSIGRGDRARAVQMASGALFHVALITFALSLCVLPFVRPLLALMGARGAALDAAVLFSVITLPANVFLGLGMAAMGVLRATGDARRSMYVTLSAALVASVLDPLFILVFKWGVAGAAWAAFIARLVIAAAGLWYVIRRHDMLARPAQGALLRDLRPLMAVAIPAIITNLATPVATAWALRIFAGYGEAIVAGIAVIDRITPVAFGLLFAMSGAVGPIVGQNFGAGNFTRVRHTLTVCYGVAAIYVLGMWALLALAAPWIAQAFGARDETADIIFFFCRYGTSAWLFLGCLFAANAAFNNLGYPVMATAFNWGRTTLGTMPFVTLGAYYAGPRGAILGMSLGALFVGIGAIFASYWIVGRLESRHAERLARERQI